MNTPFDTVTIIARISLTIVTASSVATLFTRLMKTTTPIRTFTSMSNTLSSTCVTLSIGLTYPRTRLLATAMLITLALFGLPSAEKTTTLLPLTTCAIRLRFALLRALRNAISKITMLK